MVVILMGVTEGRFLLIEIGSSEVIQPSLISVKGICVKACDAIFSKVGSATTNWACWKDSGLVAGSCELVAGGPEDPLGDLCAGFISPLFLVSCMWAINKVGEFGAKHCKKSICGSKEAERIYNEYVEAQKRRDMGFMRT